MSIDSLQAMRRKQVAHQLMGLRKHPDAWARGWFIGYCLAYNIRTVQVNRIIELMHKRSRRMGEFA